MGKSPAAPARTGAEKLQCGTSILCNCSACVPAAATPTMMVGGRPRERKPSAKAREHEAYMQDERAAHGRDEDGGAATDRGTPAAKRARAGGSAAAKLPAHLEQERRDAAGKQAKAAARKARKATECSTRVPVANADPFITNPNYYRDYTSNPLTAWQFLHHATGLSQDQSLFELMHVTPDPLTEDDEDNVAVLKAETMKDLKELIENIKQRSSWVVDDCKAARPQDTDLLSCAACGIREYNCGNTTFLRHSLDALELLQF